MHGPPPALTDRFGDALALASATHGHQRRPGTGIPYVAHLLVVTGLVLEHGGDEDEAIAALLHDAVEDGGGAPLLDELRERFGPRVAEVVEACSDTTTGGEARSWRDRKTAYVEHLPELRDEGVLRVVLADKVHNARSIVREHRRLGPALWDRFHDRSGQDAWNKFVTGTIATAALNVVAFRKTDSSVIIPPWLQPMMPMRDGSTCGYFCFNTSTAVTTSSTSLPP